MNEAGAGASSVPRNAIERAADAALDAVEAVLAEAGARPSYTFISIVANGLPEGELDAVTAAGGEDLPTDLEERSRELLALLIGLATKVGQQLGVTVTVLPMEGRNRG